ncbi:major facilitator superfamily domain-containing protein [Apodospora peruviana]|uniref:Major facilitator superfamily domain-containing protein n=1 Tax=Apodospora peruviana TaxID=516989 RepID=A0AAE0ISS0_9PEZI|nr:major facilitator superfamily domain-containing protein [Apodospora peruviana]
MFSCLDTSIVSTALVTISVDLGNSQDATWTILGYLLTYMSFAVSFSKLSDIYGRKNLLAVAWLFFSGFSILCASARTMTQLIIGRALQGIGGSGLYSLAQVCLVEQGPNRPEVVGALVGLTLSISYVLGPLLGGAISGWSWRGVFWINVPFGALAMIGVYTLWPEERRTKYDSRTAISKIDFIGNTLLIGATILLFFAIEQAGSFVWQWSSPVIICSLVVSGVCWILLSIWESYLFYGRSQQIEPIFPLRLAVGRVYLSCLIVTLLTGFIYIALVITIPERLQIVYGDNPLGAGIHLLPMLGCCAFGSFLGGAVSKQKNLTSQTLIIASGLQVLGLGLLYGYTGPDSPTQIRFMLGFTAIYGLGVGLCFAACTMIAAIEARNDDLATAQGAVAQSRIFGGALGLAVCTVLFNEKLQRALGPGSGSSLSPADLDELHRSPIAVVHLSAESQLEVKAVYFGAFRNQMLTMLVVAIAAALVSFGTYRARPSPIIEAMVGHSKDRTGDVDSTAGETELESSSSVRSLIH